MTTSDDLITCFQNALNNTTVAGTRVYNPRTWPVPPGVLPTILIQSPDEHKESKGPNAPAYDVFTTMHVIGKLTQKGAPNDQTANILLAALGAFQRQIEIAVINNYALYLIISEITSVDIKKNVVAEGNQPYGEVVMDFTCKFYQGAELFAPPLQTPIEQFTLFADLINVFDPTGTYTSEFPDTVHQPPRHRGPDGRAEVGVIMSLGEIDRISDSGDSRISDRGLQRVSDASL